MLRYTLRRLLGAIPTLLLVIVLAFLLVHAAPGGPFDDERALPADIEANIAAAYHLDEPLPMQFLRYLGGVLRGDFGPSYSYRDYTVSELIGRSFPVSVQLGMLAMLLATVVGVSLGIVAALNKNSALDKVVMGFAMTGISIPVFVIAPVLVLFFAVKLHWLPASWTGSEGGSRFLLPVLSLALPQIAYVARLTRASLIDVLSSDFIRTARAQGLGTAAIVRYHALKPAMLPVLSYMGPAVAAVLTGSVVVEEIFGIPGLGQLFVRASLNRDYTLVLGVVIFYAALIVLLNLIVDLLYGAIDPRIRRQ
ncbi:MAG: oligopeptide ABC transporter permease OppB [Gammaproteobacteria bacterium]|nr:oligopeptide ABC transporter permease OppB [Gammaproteobacteria bacterium]MDH3757056.1 oligopeptide ABC transporter permease OppB [Gammaproteobacteria bacterium]MDH3863067.1 oligopeptide ABC transporter permease OppB [Gammaproteobacteria bacterium]MDH3904047.1 oligopeptide ABC transporter permease OppB [Gammaproteobacteria bacterium]MDH3907840.1 oligopeptide ABC transporter permease OppB [Gammaproteobacteria bacterium]